ncbi:hypothetical protein LTR84_006571 [Exophiala bonariae]|uniref:Cytochrome P450 n=1 Tax=Exophiala bonariae TaxID=1690606 RepID=A0AAV9N496_9EURO|nr:hypothetical protein LTR84_006571 [Exophiala bonariae]
MDTIMDNRISPYAATNILLALITRLIAPASTILLLAYIAYYGFLSPLSGIPGPFIARFTRLWLAYHGWKGDFHIVLTEVHEKYGTTVRVGPDEVLTLSPDAIKKIYGAGSLFNKSDFYAPLKGTRTWDLFAEGDSIVHRNNRRSVNHVYATSSLIDLEPYVDSAIQHFVSILRTKEGKSFDFDVIGEVTFSQRFGLMETGEESESLKIIKRAARSGSWVGHIPWVYRIHQRLSPLIGNHLALNARSGAIRDFTLQQAQSRIKRGSDHRDMLSKLIELHGQNPAEVDNTVVISMATSNVFAGSDTTAVALRSIFYHLLKNLGCLKKLLNEINDVVGDIDIDKPVTYEQANKMPYLQAVMNEANRIHPVVAQSLPRIVPEGGLQVEGHSLPAGTIIGSSPYVLGRSEHIYGQDAKMFRPERWLEGDRSQLLSGFLAFGGTSRMCLGKNLVWIEVSKVVPTILRNFVINFADTDVEWKLQS